ncbi:MAG: PilZ domain-containing protein [bacterium]
MRQTSDNPAEVSDHRIGVRPPLQAETEDMRRFVRLEIISPARLRRIKDIFGGFCPEGDYEIQATILNLSDGGVLLECDQPLNEGDVVGMRFTVSQVAPLDGVLGLVKRCEPDENLNLIGIQFVNREDLTDYLSEIEMELLSGNFADFNAIVKRVLSGYLQSEAK